MNISFDLDNTLIPNSDEFETENRGFLAKLIGIEKIRKGTSELIYELQSDNHKIHIYTTSFRSKLRIKFMFKYYGIKVDRIVNQKENRRVLKSLHIKSSKFPPVFNFDVHIDDMDGVKIESEIFNFNVIIVKPTNVNWSSLILESIQKMNS